MEFPAIFEESVKFTRKITEIRAKELSVSCAQILPIVVDIRALDGP
jgi:hypothetical protein